MTIHETIELTRNEDEALVYRLYQDSGQWMIEEREHRADGTCQIDQVAYRNEDEGYASLRRCVETSENEYGWTAPDGWDWI